MSQRNGKTLVQGITELATIVSEANALADRLLSVLTDERGALGAGDVESIDNCGQRKTECLARLDKLEHERKTLCSALGLGNGTLDGLFEQYGLRAAATPGWQDFLGKLARCREANAVNGQVTHLRRRHVERALQILRGAQVHDAGLYGPDGRDDVSSATTLGQA